MAKALKKCRKIQRELSAYLDGELAPTLRANVEEHLTSCAQCQQELSEMKTLATGLAALPNLRPAPRFLTEVRRKIVRGEKPEPLTWRDYAFRPMWLKIPLEVAALVLIVGLIMRGQNSEPTERVTVFKPGRPYEGDNGSVNNSSSETATKPEPVETLKSVIVDRPPVAEIAEDRPAAPEAQPEVSATREVREKEENRIDTTETASPTVASDEKKSVEQSAVNAVAAGRVEDQQADGARSTLELHSNGELSSMASLPSPSPSVGAIGSVESAQSKPGETVTVHARDFEDVRNRAQRLAARCNGRIVAVPQSKDTTEQTFFVELPKEYVAAFKLELLKVPALSAKGGIVNESLSNSASAPTGVLTGNAVTNDSINAPAPLGLRNDATAPASTAVLEIRVVAPSD